MAASFRTAFTVLNIEIEQCIFQHQSYVYISESSQFEEETDSLFLNLDPTATISIWQPKKLAVKTGASNLLEDEMVSGFKIFCPYHLLVSHSSSDVHKVVMATQRRWIVGMLLIPALSQDYSVKAENHTFCSFSECPVTKQI